MRRIPAGHRAGSFGMFTIEMTARDGGTQLTLTHAGVPDTDLGRGHEEGWTAIVGEVAKALE